jgi:hypothetical protein
MYVCTYVYAVCVCVCVCVCMRTHTHTHTRQRMAFWRACARWGGGVGATYVAGVAGMACAACGKGEAVSARQIRAKKKVSALVVTV